MKAYLLYVSKVLLYEYIDQKARCYHIVNKLTYTWNDDISLTKHREQYTAIVYATDIHINFFGSGCGARLAVAIMIFIVPAMARDGCASQPRP